MISQLIMNPLFSLASVGGKVKGADTILENDPHGFTVTMISVAVVLSALIVLGFLIWGFSRLVIMSAKRTALKTIEEGSNPKRGVAPVKPGEASGEIIAAISLALKLNKDALHDHESTVITINKVARAYSPWSSKLHGLTNMPR